MIQAFRNLNAAGGRVLIPHEFALRRLGNIGGTASGLALGVVPGMWLTAGAMIGGAGAPHNSFVPRNIDTLAFVLPACSMGLGGAVGFKFGGFVGATFAHHPLWTYIGCQVGIPLVGVAAQATWAKITGEF